MTSKSPIEPGFTGPRVGLFARVTQGERKGVVGYVAAVTEHHAKLRIAAKDWPFPSLVAVEKSRLRFALSPDLLATFEAEQDSLSKFLEGADDLSESD